VEEELDFTRNYLELEKFRFKGQFNYSITISPEVDLNWEIPKMIIQSPVENAVKHGFYSNQQSGLLTILAYMEDSHLVLKINDNGMGRQQALTQISTGTGKGLQIMEEFLELYEKITGIKITSRIEDIYSEDGQPAGTSVTVLIPAS
jgi:sensor histidine kinase YesM